MSASLGTAVDEQLDLQDAGEVDVTVDDATASVDVRQSGPVGARVGSIAVSAPRGEVTHTVDALPHALRALPEPIIPVEVAPTLRGAVLRSDPDAIEHGEFFEVEVRDDRIRIGRYRQQTNGRAAIDFDLTRDQLKRLVDGLRCPEEG